MPENQDLSDPKTFIDLPFPSLLEYQTARFDTSHPNNVPHFQYMGRRTLQRLEKRIQEENFQKSYQDLYVYGTSGSGKSHILAALVCRLIHKGERVLYIPDCESFLKDPFRVIRTALLFAFYDSTPTNLRSITNLPDTHLVTSLSKYPNLYIIVDQLNALEVKEDDPLTQAKNHASQLLNRLKYRHRYIFCASANEKSNRQADTKDTVFSIFGGMDEAC
jgi:Cdc6-like AAA superfamily ATPase